MMSWIFQKIKIIKKKLIEHKKMVHVSKHFIRSIKDDKILKTSMIKSYQSVNDYEYNKNVLLENE